MAPERFLSRKLIYKAKRGRVYDTNYPRYNCYTPAISGTYSLLDCWVVDSEGNAHPGYNVSPVPIHSDNLGDVVGEVGNEK